MTETHLVLGSGTVGTKLAAQLSLSGNRVVLISRSQKGPALAKVEQLHGDASSFESLRSALPRADFVYNCVNPPYNKWDSEWPPIQRAIIEYTKRSNAVLVTCSNLYGYGPNQKFLTEDLPLLATWKNGRIRAEMWLEVKGLHDAGEIRATEVRGSDYICPSDQSRMGNRVVPRLMQKKSVQLLGSLDKLHTWTDPDDVANLMMVVGQNENAWGKPWHVPSNEPMTQMQVIRDIALELGIKNPKVSSVSPLIEMALGLFNPVIRELKNTAYQFNQPFVMSDERSRKAFGLQPKAWDLVIRDLVKHYTRT
jgi:nucleoside-diphosphate-sugar epimerase